MLIVQKKHILHRCSVLVNSDWIAALDSPQLIKMYLVNKLHYQVFASMSYSRRV